MRLTLLFLFLALNFCSQNQSQNKVSEREVTQKALLGPEQVLAIDCAAIVKKHIILFDIKAEKKVRIFDLKGTFVTEFGVKGEGPEEFIGGGYLSVDSDHKSFWVYELMNRRVKKFDLENILNGKFHPEIIVTIQADSGLPFKVTSVAEEQFLGSGYLSRGRLAIYGSDGDFLHAIGEEPVRGPLAAQHSHGHEGAFDFDSENQVVWLTSRLGSVVSCFNLNTKVETKVIGPEKFSPEYEIVQAGSGQSMTYSEDSRFGFIDVAFCPKNHRWYLLYSGEYRAENPDAYMGKKVLVYDLEGNLLEVLLLSEPIFEITVSAEGGLFGYNSENLFEMVL